MPIDGLRSIGRSLASIPTLRSLRHRNYRLFFFGQLLSLMGSWMQIMAQQWLVYTLTGSAVWLGTIGFLQNIPILFLSIFAGSLADKMPKQRLIIMTQSVSLMQALLLGCAVYFDFASITLVAVLAFVLGIINAFDIPIRQSFVFELVGKEDLTNAIGLNSAAFNTARIIGPAIGGVVIISVGLSWCFFLNAFSFIAVLFSLTRMTALPAPSSGEQPVNIIEGIREGVRTVLSDQILTALFSLVIIMTLFGWSYSVLLPIFAEEILSIGASGLGHLLTAVGVGALISAIAVASFERKVTSRDFVVFGIIIFTISVIIFSVSRDPILSMLSLVGVGGGLVAFFATANATVQRSVPDRIRGRVMGLYALVFQGLFPFGSLMIGFFADVIGAPLATLVGGIVCGVSGFFVYSTIVNKNGKVHRAS